MTALPALRECVSHSGPSRMLLIPDMPLFHGIVVRCVMLLLGTLACYVLGTGWFMYQSGRALGDSLTLCVLPFLPGDTAKIALAAFLAPRLRKALRSTAV